MSRSNWTLARDQCSGVIPALTTISLMAWGALLGSRSYPHSCPHPRADKASKLREAIGAVAGVADEIARWGTDPAPPPPEEVRRALAMRFTAPPTSELDAIADDLVTALH